MCEDAPCCGCCGPQSDDGAYDEPESYGWPGDGSGEDDLADYNANEADDYRDEGADESECYAEDQHLDGMYEE